MSFRVRKARFIKDQLLEAMEKKKMSDRNRIIIRRVLDGETYRAVGADFGICQERVRGICFIAFRKMGFDV